MAPESNENTYKIENSWSVVLARLASFGHLGLISNPDKKFQNSEIGRMTTKEQTM